MTFFLFSILFINIFIFVLNKRIATSINLFDKPDNIRKFHKKDVPLTGGFFIYATITAYFVIHKLNLINFNFLSDNELYIYYICATLFFALGIYDDKKNLNANYKLSLTIIIILINIFFDETSTLKKINLSFLPIFDIGGFSIFWTLICYLLFINAFNMLDGINLQTALYSLVLCLIFLIYGFNYFFFISIIISLIFFSILNYKNNSFMGDSGTYLLSYTFSYFFIKSYNYGNIVSADLIVLAMFLPGLELVRVFFERLLIRKHPFSADRRHLHHLLLKKFNLFYTLLIIQSVITLPLIFAIITENILLPLIIQLIIYTFLVIKYKKLSSFS
jgi:UDP-GlcNAc:undecaprenyl-phosphate/decaprenyl-phosphate GlcNAc-1-phosphate transferase